MAKRYQEVRASERTPVATDAPDNPFKGKHIVITGDVDGYERSDLQSIIADLGGNAYLGSSKNTDMAIIGHKFGSKAGKVESLIAQGQSIEIIEEYSAIKLLKKLNV